MVASRNIILVEDLKPGMSCSQPIYIEDSEDLFLPANTNIEENDIKKLMTWGVSEVTTNGQFTSPFDPAPEIKPLSSDIVVENYKNFLKKRKLLISIHQKARIVVDNVHNAIRKDEPFDTTELEISVEEIIKILKENKNIFLFLYGLDEGKSYLVNHSVNVTFYSIIIGMELNYSHNLLKELGLGAMLIDAGMVKMPVYIIHKQSNLTDQEFNQIKTHPLHGYKAVRKLGHISERAAEISLQHHEQFDGKGYPRGLTGKSISEFAKIVAIADSYEAQITSRSYKKKIYFYQAMRNLIASSINKFDPAILKVFLARMSVYPIGSIVELNDKSIGMVIESIPQKPLRPILKLVFTSDGKKVNDTVLINLLETTSLYIAKAVDEESGINIFDIL